MIRISSGVCVDAHDIKEVIAIEEPPSVKILYEVKEKCEVSIYLDDKNQVEAFKQSILLSKDRELRQKHILKPEKSLL